MSSNIWWERRKVHLLIRCVANTFDAITLQGRWLQGIATAPILDAVIEAEKSILYQVLDYCPSSHAMA